MSCLRDIKLIEQADIPEIGKFRFDRFSTVYEEMPHETMNLYAFYIKSVLIMIHPHRVQH